jgi:hemoglobin
MTDARPVPSLYEWIGGSVAITRLLTTFYDRVPADPILGPIFASMSPDHVEQVAAFVGEVFGGPKIYGAKLGGHPHMIRQRAGRALTEVQRSRWITLLLECADQIGVPSDPEFRSAFVGYLEWGTRLAVINSRECYRQRRGARSSTNSWSSLVPAPSAVMFRPYRKTGTTT